MDSFIVLTGIIFIIGYIFITLEHQLNTHKSAVALSLASVLWVLVAIKINDFEKIEHYLAEAGIEVFNIIAFLLAAMAIVEILTHYRFFDLIREKLYELNFGDRKQFMVLGTLTFFLSALVDNLTSTIVMTQISTRFFRGWNLLVMVSGVVILANAGGAWSPIGDVTTIMIWLAGKFSAWEIISQTILPSMILGVVSSALLINQLKRSTQDVEPEAKVVLTRGEKIIIGSALGSFLLPIFVTRLGLQPYVGLLFGLGIVWLLIDFLKVRSPLHKHHLEMNIEKAMQGIDIASLQFFIGILLAVSALQVTGLLEYISLWMYGEVQAFSGVAVGSIVIGALSSIIDNVPLTAVAIDMITLNDSETWTLLALAVGTGGSFLLIGSVAGVIAAGIIKDLTFGKYLKIATIPAIAGYIGAISAWFIQRGLWNMFVETSLFSDIAFFFQ